MIRTIVLVLSLLLQAQYSSARGFGGMRVGGLTRGYGTYGSTGIAYRGTALGIIIYADGTQSYG